MSEYFGMKERLKTRTTVECWGKNDDGGRGFIGLFGNFQKYQQNSCRVRKLPVAHTVEIFQTSAKVRRPQTYRKNQLESVKRRFCQFGYQIRKMLSKAFAASVKATIRLMSRVSPTGGSKERLGTQWMVV
jgi:hypothetical protein